MKLTVLLGIAVIAAVLTLLLKKYQPEHSLLLGLLAGLLILALLLPRMSSIAELTETLAQMADVPWEYGSLLIKGLGICLLTQSASDACKDAGEQGLAFKAELAGKVALLLLSLPVFERVLQLATSLINGQGAE